jgi:uncharacterized protein (UPF0332 family)
MIEEQIRYRIQRAKETYGDAILLFEKGSWNSSINRLYYSAFYVAIALLLHLGLEVKSHNGVKRKLGELVLAGKLNMEQARIYGILSDLRNKGDYDDLFDFDKEMVDRLLGPVKNFILGIEKLIEGSKTV